MPFLTLAFLDWEFLKYADAIFDLSIFENKGILGRRENDQNLVKSCFLDMIREYALTPDCILHSDRGSTYASTEYQASLKSYDARTSMSRKGDCCDNAPMESFFRKLKTEYLFKKPLTINEAKALVYQFVWYFYPKIQPHASNIYHHVWVQFKGP